ncbi:MAG: hypothetical protein RLZZ293_105 [Pseudomonadota bacterium]|jgi:hypothetical protein
MNHILDIILVSLFAIGALIYLLKNYTKSASSCGSACSGCQSKCTKIQEQTKIIRLVPKHK